ncbi:MAG: hypothetical protein NT096_12895 [Proteobacteria bacterium]|nr:hypothetical protein [Pseudomonadota bacterium]
MSKVAMLNCCPEVERNEVYSLLLPSTIFERFQIDPKTFENAREKKVVQIVSHGCGETTIEVRLNPGDKDCIFYMDVADSSDLVQLLWSFININDPSGERFNTDVDECGNDLWLKWGTRNLKEELRSMKAGLAPGQTRRGLRLMNEVNRCLDTFCCVLNIKSIFMEALFYHNAIIYERHGFRYFEGEKRMRRINELFQAGGKLYEKLDGSTPFRRRGLEKTVRGRSWAIHDGILNDIVDDILDEPWYPPKMYRMVGQYYNIDTFPGGSY